MTATFWSNFSKRNNSTKQPSGSGTSYTVYLKDNVSVLAPVFRIEGIDLTVTYCQWNGRYYFVRDIVLSNNAIYEVHCEIDPMATWKSAIGSSSQYVLRSASQSDGTIVDMFYPTKKDGSSFRCSRCQMEIDLNTVERLKQGEIVECDTCHFLIYFQA